MGAAFQVFKASGQKGSASYRPASLRAGLGRAGSVSVVSAGAQVTLGGALERATDPGSRKDTTPAATGNRF